MKKEDEIRVMSDIATLQTKVEFISIQVSNHIPTAIRELDNRLDTIEKKLAYWAGGIVVFITITELVLKFIK